MMRTRRSFAAAAMTSGSSDYVSPFRDFFDMMEENRTSLGTTPENPPPKPQERYLKCGIREDALRYRTMFYGRQQLPPHVQPGEHRVTLKVQLDDIPIESESEREILFQIVGNRVREDKNELRLSSDQFGSRIENKRHLESMLDRIVLSAKRLAREIDQERDT